VELGGGVIGIGGVGIGLLNGSSAHFLFNPTLNLAVAVGLIINTQSDTADKSSIGDSSNERNLIVKSTAKFNFARLICLLICGGSSSSLSKYLMEEFHQEQLHPLSAQTSLQTFSLLWYGQSSPPFFS